MNKYIYKLTITTNNPSADKSGYFESEDLLIKTAETFIIASLKDQEYYGKVSYDKETILLNELD